jgi:hypothetical protein
MFNRFAIFTTMACAVILSSTPSLEAQMSLVKNTSSSTVLGRMVQNGSVYEDLVRDGFDVSMVQEPETVHLLG